MHETDALRIKSNWTALHISRRLIEVGVALSAESNLERLLELILQYAQELTHCDAGSLYIREDENLRVFISQNDSLRNQILPLNNHSIAGYVVLRGETLNIPDVYQLNVDLPYTFNKEVDRKTGYRTRSLLTVPMRDGMGRVIGALQLLNRLSPRYLKSPHQGAPPEEWTEAFSIQDLNVAEALASQAAVAYQNVKLREELKEAHFETIFRLSVAAEYRDQDTSLHLKRMSNYSRIIAKHLGLSEHEQETILYASPMHDVGKLGIPDSILLKPGPLTPEERLHMQRHPEIGAEILGKGSSELMRKSAVIALSHHEKFDGSGYPQGLKGEEIPLEGRIVALADVFDALASKRAYKEAWQLEQILELVDRSTGTHFDPMVVAAFKRGFSEIMDVYHLYGEPEGGLNPALTHRLDRQDHPDPTLTEPHLPSDYVSSEIISTETAS